MIKNIMGAAIAVALAVGIGTTGVRSNTTYKKPTQIIAAAKTTTLTDYHSNTEFTRSSDVKNIISTYGLKDSNKTSKIVYIPINNYSVNDADGQNNEVSVDTRLSSYSVKKEGYKDQVSYVRSIAADTSLTQSIKESVATTYDFSNIASVSGKNAALESCLTSAYGFSVSNRSNMNETFKLSSKNSADLNIYVLNRTYDYQLWETDLSHDISSDSYLGNGTIKRPVGLIITVSKNS